MGLNFTPCSGRGVNHFLSELRVITKIFEMSRHGGRLYSEPCQGKARADEMSSDLTTR